MPSPCGSGHRALSARRVDSPNRSPLSFASIIFMVSILKAELMGVRLCLPSPLLAFDLGYLMAT